MSTWAASREFDCNLPQALTRTPVEAVVSAYLEYVATVKTLSSVRVDNWYVRRIFGLDGKGGPCLWSRYFEDINTAQVHDFLIGTMRKRRLSAKSGNRYREVIMRMFNWAMRYRDIRLPYNPAARIERFREHAREIRFLTLTDIQTQLNSLADVPY